MDTSMFILAGVSAMAGDGLCDDRMFRWRIPIPKGGTGGDDGEPKPISPANILIERLVAAAAGIALWAAVAGRTGTDTGALGVTAVGFAAGILVGRTLALFMPRG